MNDNDNIGLVSGDYATARFIKYVRSARKGVIESSVYSCILCWQEELLGGRGGAGRAIMQIITCAQHSDNSQK